MSDTPSKCPKCDGTMQNGFIADADRRTIIQWVAGAPVRTFWMGLQVRDKTKYDVRTYRCERCGLLESYAK